METAYECGRYSIHYRSSLELTHQWHNSITRSSAVATGEGQREPGDASVFSPSPLARETGAHCKQDPKTVQQNGCRADSMHAATADLPANARKSLVPAIASARGSSDPSGRRCGLNCSQQLSGECKQSMADCGCSSAALGEPSSVRCPHPSSNGAMSSKIRDPNWQDMELSSLLSVSDIPVLDRLSRSRSRSHVDQLRRQKSLAVEDANDASLLHECHGPARDEAMLERPFNRLQVEDERTSLVVDREFRVTEVLSHRAKLDGRFPAEVDRSHEQTCGDESAAKHGRRDHDDDDEEDGSDSGTGIEVYHPDNPGVLRKKIEDLESQIQDLQEANVATYEEVLRLQKENNALKDCRGLTASLVSPSHEVWTADDKAPHRPEPRRGSTEDNGTPKKCHGAPRSDASLSTPRADRLVPAGITKERDGATGVAKPMETLTLDQRDTSAGRVCSSMAAVRGREQLTRCEDASPPPGVPCLRPKRLTYDDGADGEVDVQSAGQVRQVVEEAAATRKIQGFDDVGSLAETTHANGNVAGSFQLRDPVAPSRMADWRSSVAAAAEDTERRWSNADSGRPVSNLSRSLGHEPAWRTSSLIKPGVGVIRSPRATRTVVPRTLADVSLGDTIKYTRPDGRVGRGIASYVGWCNERREMCVGIMTSPPENCSALALPVGSSPGAWLRKDVVVPFQKVLLIWKKADGCS